jgi:hypothetical protein
VETSNGWIIDREMKRILVLSYYFPPSNNIGALRAKSFAQYFPGSGLSPIVISRHWRGGEKIWDDYLTDDTRPITEGREDRYTLIQLPYDGRKYKFGKRLGPFGYRGFLLGSALTGVFQPDADAFATFYETARAQIMRQRFDYLFVTSPPFNIVKLGYKLSKEFNIPLIVDLRDLWSNKLLSIDNSVHSFRDKVLHALLEAYAKKWLNEAKLISVVSPQMAIEVKRLLPSAKTIVVTNGFEGSLFASDKTAKNSKFTFSAVGTLYPQQDLSIMIDGLGQFLSGKNLEKIQLNFIGTGVIAEMSQRIKDALPEKCTRVTERLPHCQAVQAMVESDVLFYAGWKGYRGVTSGKIFEYLASGRNILIAPGDKDVIDALLRETGAGKTAHSTSEFVQIMNEWYEEWQSLGTLNYQGITKKIARYSRDKQAAYLGEHILQIAGV